MKISETTNCTILWPDLRGHGLNPPVQWTSFGPRESDDLLAALDFLRTLKGDGQNKLVGGRFGVYGVELGAYVGLRAAVSDTSIQVLALDSLPRDQNEMIDSAVRNDVRVNTSALVVPARLATRIFFVKQYDNKSSCEMARALGERRVLLLAGDDDGYLRASTKSLVPCFPKPANLETRTDLSLTGFTLPSATGEQGEGYDRPVIDFFVKNLH